MKKHDAFRLFAQKVSQLTGSKHAFAVAVLMVAIWASLGPHFRYGDSWQLVINTATTIITFLMVFLIQYTQNRDTAAMQLKLDELVRAVKSARDSLVDIEDQSDEMLDRARAEAQAFGRQHANDSEPPPERNAARA